MRARALGSLLLAVALAAGCDDARSQNRGARPAFDDAFWTRWGDGKAEVAGYDLVHPRYGESRKGVAVAVVVTETFSESERVKADPGRHPDSDTYPVVKLNLVEDFSTGIYDYNLMTSAFVALAPHRDRPQGAPVKVSFSAQEWCGHAWGQALFDGERVRHVLHSYFDGEGDRDTRLPLPPGGIAEDALMLWARGLASPRLEPGGSVTVPMLRSLKTSRLKHLPPAWIEVALSRAAGTETIAVPAGSFEVERLTASAPGQRSHTFWVEAAEPRRLVRWETSDGERGELLGADRIEYWRMNAAGMEGELSRLGLSPRPPRIP
jgi:hypothetical protein